MIRCDLVRSWKTNCSIGMSAYRGTEANQAAEVSAARCNEAAAGSTLVLVAVEGGRDVVGTGGAGEHVGEHDGVLDRQLGPRPHREVGGVHRVAE